MATKKELEKTMRKMLDNIRSHCLDCSGGSRKEVENCEILTCKLYKYRVGRKFMNQKG